MAGVGLDGHCEILGARIADVETELQWEGYFDELKRRTRKIGALPNDRSLLHHAVSILMGIDEEWRTGRRYLNMEAMQ